MSNKKESEVFMKNFLVLMCAVFLLGCTESWSDYENRRDPIELNVPAINFYKIKVRGIAGMVYVDSCTRVEYVSENGYGLTTRIDSLGKPIIYTGEFPK